MATISGEQLEHALAGKPLPARRWQTVAWAEFNCASEQVLEALRHMPDRTYASIYAIKATLTAIERRETAARRSRMRGARPSACDAKPVPRGGMIRHQPAFPRPVHHRGAHMTLSRLPNGAPCEAATPGYPPEVTRSLHPSGPPVISPVAPVDPVSW